MTKTEMTIEEIIMPVEAVEPVKRPRGRPRKNIDEVVEPDDEANKRGRGRPKKDIKDTDDPEYFKMYYRNNLKGYVECENCGRCVEKGHLNKHKKTKICERVTEFKINLLI